MNRCIERLYNGLVKENPTFVLVLGMCPTLAVTTSARNGLGMGLTTMVVLALSNAFISMLRKVIPDKVRIPAFIVIIASFVTMMELLLEGFLPSLYDALGIYIPLIVVNCIILGRAESYASKNPVLPSLFDGIGMGLGFTVALTCIGAVREILGAGQIFGLTVMPPGYVPVSIFIMAPGAFFVLAMLTAIQNQVKISGEKKGRDMSKLGSGCPKDCLNCEEKGCSSRFYDTESGHEEAAEARKTAARDTSTAQETSAAQKVSEIQDTADAAKTQEAAGGAVQKETEEKEEIEETKEQEQKQPQVEKEE